MAEIVFFGAFAAATWFAWSADPAFGFGLYSILLIMLTTRLCR